MDLKLIPNTSKNVESFFSKVKFNMTLFWNSILTSALENIMFLKKNASFMSLMTVQKALNIA